MKVVPYEHKGKIIRKLKMSNFREAVEVQNMYTQENDIWLKKMLALKLLNCEQINSLSIDKKQLLKISQCQIEL